MKSKNKDKKSLLYFNDKFGLNGQKYYFGKLALGHLKVKKESNHLIFKTVTGTKSQLDKLREFFSLNKLKCFLF